MSFESNSIEKRYIFLINLFINIRIEKRFPVGEK